MTKMEWTNERFDRKYSQLERLSDCGGNSRRDPVTVRCRQCGRVFSTNPNSLGSGQRGGCYDCDDRGGKR